MVISFDKQSFTHHDFVEFINFESINVKDVVSLEKSRQECMSPFSTSTTYNINTKDAYFEYYYYDRGKTNNTIVWGAPHINSTHRKFSEHIYTLLLI